MTDDDYTLEFVATRGNGPLGDIAIDDTSVEDGYCESTTNTVNKAATIV